MAQRKAIFTVETPFGTTKVVTLHDNTWNDHVLKSHPEMEGRIEVVRNTLITPTFVCTGTAEGYFQFVSHEHTLLDELPTVVVVSSVDTEGNAVASAFPGRKHKYSKLSNFDVKWSKL